MLIYQFATAHIGRWLVARPEPLVVNYHNVTPPHHFAPWDNGLARHELQAQSQLRPLAPRGALGLAVSAYNEVELRDRLPPTTVVPPAAMLPTSGTRPGPPPASAPATARGGECGASRAQQGESSSP